MEMRHLDDPLLLSLYGLLIITGLVDCFFGYRAFRYALSLLLGFVGLGLGAYAGYYFAEGSWTITLVGGAVGMLLGMILAFTFFRGALVVAGAMSGYALLSPLIGDLAPWLQLVVLVLGCGIFGYLAIGVARFGIMLGTSLTGSFRVIYGSWYLFLGGPAMLSLGADKDAGWHLLGTSQEPFVAMILLAAVGFAVQFFREQKREGKRPVEE